MNDSQDVVSPAPITDEEIQGFIEAGFGYEQSGDWGEAITAFQTAVDNLDQIASGPPFIGPANLSEQEKELAVDSLLGILRCRLAMERSQEPEIRVSVIPKLTEDEVRRTVDAIKKYRVRNQRLVWNKLLADFKNQEAQYRDADMPESAEIFYHWGQVSLMTLYSALLKEQLKPVQLPRRARETQTAYRDRQMKRFRQRWEAQFFYLRKLSVMRFYSFVTDFRMSIIRPFISLVIIPWFVFGGLYYLAIKDILLNQQPVPVNIGWQNLVYAISFSVFNFTGAGPGDITLQSKPGVHILAAIEVAWGYFVTVIIISRFINFLTNLTTTVPGNGKEPRNANSSQDDSRKK